MEDNRATAEGGIEAPFWFFPLIPGAGVHLVNRKGPQPKLDEIFSNEPGRKRRGEDGEFEDDEEVDNEEVEVVVDASASILWIKDCRDCTLRIELTHHLDKIVFENLARCEFYFSAKQGGCDYLEVADYCQELFVSFEEDLVIPLVTVDNGDILNFAFPRSWGPASGKNCMFITAGSTALLAQIKDAPKRHKVPRGDHDITLQAVVTRDDEAEDRSLFRSAELLMAGCASARERLAFIARKVYLHENPGHSEEEEMARACSTGNEGEATRIAHRRALIQSGAKDLLAQLLAKDDLEKGSKRSGHGSEEELKEYFDPQEVLNAKVQALAKLMKESKYGVAYTGAGVSTSADIPDYRGPQGVWTLKDRGEASSGGLKDLKSACPTPTHMALTEMLKNGYMRHIASTNLDGLHRRSGLERKDLSELHGNCFVEKCRECGAIYERDEDIGGDSLDHLTGNDCEDEDCMGALVDNIINFGEFTERPILDKARYHGTHADLTLVLGTSMKVTAACYMPLEVLSKRDPDAENGSGQTARSQGKMVIVNLQKTPFDHLAAIRIFAKCDEVIQLLAKELDIQVPKYQPKLK